MLRLAAAMLIAVPLAACNAADSEIGTSPAGMEQQRVTVTADGTDHVFITEIARTPEEQSRGLMYRESLADDAAMLFLYAPPEPASFWMKNTLIPLDMIFIRPDGSIARIHENTIPESTDPYSAYEDVSAVLEIRGGRARELGIEAGDTVRWPDQVLPPGR